VQQRAVEPTVATVQAALLCARSPPRQLSPWPSDGDQHLEGVMV